MNYTFPEIRTINDVLPHIEGREEFIVAEREFGTVINYQVEMPDSFPSIDNKNEELTNIVRRECRGIIFNKEGKIMSRPFHKFFNVGQKAETQVYNIDMSQPHIVMEKMDGSMIRPILVDGYLRLATKMGVTNVSMQAEAWLAAQDPAKKEWLRAVVKCGYTPLFEWISPFNQIVLAYEEADLVYLGSRGNVTGVYFFDEYAPFTKVPRYGSVEGNIGDYIARQREKEGREGDIIRFADGHMLKVKNDWYVRIHKTLDRVRFDRNIVDLIVNENLDDVIGMLPLEQANYIREFEQRFWKAFKQKENRLYGLQMACDQSYKGDRKAIATQFVPQLPDKRDASFIFGILDGYGIRELMLQYIKKHINNNVKWDVCANWLGIIK